MTAINAPRHACALIDTNSIRPSNAQSWRDWINAVKRDPNIIIIVSPQEAYLAYGLGMPVVFVTAMDHNSLSTVPIIPTDPLHYIHDSFPMPWTFSPHHAAAGIWSAIPKDVRNKIQKGDNR